MAGNRCSGCSISGTRRFFALLNRDRGHAITRLAIRLIYISSVFACVLIRRANILDSRPIVTTLMKSQQLRIALEGRANLLRMRCKRSR